MARRTDNTQLGILADYAVQALSAGAGPEWVDDIFKLVRKQAGLHLVEAWFEDGPVLIGSSGAQDEGTREIPVLDRVERIRVRSPSHRDVIVRFQFDHEPTVYEIEDLSSWFGTVFEQATVRHPKDVAGVGWSQALDMGAGVSQYAEVLEAVTRWRNGERKRCVIALSPHHVMPGPLGRRIRRAMAQAALALPDEIGTVWAANILGYSRRGRAVGPTLMLNLCEWGIRHDFRHYFYGGAPGAALEVARTMSAAFPGLIVVGSCPSPPALTPAQHDAQAQRINGARPDVLWVGADEYDQNAWIAQHAGHIEAPVVIGIGSPFDFHDRRIQSVPRPVRRLGLGWAYLLAKDLRRMSRRRLHTPLFLLDVLLECIKPPKFRRHVPRPIRMEQGNGQAESGARDRLVPVAGQMAGTEKEPDGEAVEAGNRAV
jgi:N-acetylglucosaminyldiphosphoundecaprenol N-acetyl-beta-D-mannosaminyltransferase